MRYLAEDVQTRVVRLDGPLERHKYPPVVGLIFGLVFAFVGSQIITGAALVALLAVSTGAMPGSLDALSAYPEQIFVANSIGQVFGLALLALVLARLHAHRPLPYVRAGAERPLVLGLALVGLAALFPFVNWLAVVNEALPLPQPEFLQEAERSSLEMIENLLGSGGGLAFPLLVLALTPAVCEELLFRGYLQRQLERMAGALGGIVASGMLFGFFHLRLSQALPLCVLGVYLAYLTWRTKSLWPAVLVHFAHNAFAVVYSRTAPGQETAELPATAASADAVHMPAHLVVLGLLLFAGVAYYLHMLTRTRNEKLVEPVVSTSASAAVDPLSAQHKPAQNEEDPL